MEWQGRVRRLLPPEAKAQVTAPGFPHRAGVGWSLLPWSAGHALWGSLVPPRPFLRHPTSSCLHPQEACSPGSGLDSIAPPTPATS